MASREFDLRIINARKVPFAIMSCDVAIGYRNENNDFVGLFTVPDFILKKSPTKGYFFSAPSKPYIKDGVHQVDDAGYKRYLDFFKLYAEKGADPNDPSKYSPTKAAFEARKWLIGQMVDAMKAIGIDESTVGGSGGKGPAKKAAPPAAKTNRPTPKPAAAKASIDEDETNSPLDDEDDDLPF